MLKNIGIAAHIDAGKTTLTERILYYTGVTYKIGEVHDGQAVMDYLEEEKERGITITSAVTSVSWKNTQINIVDTPGHVDFTIEVERAMRVLDGAVIVLCGVGGVEPQTETVWYQINKYKIPRLIFINKLDRTGSDFEKVLKDIEKKLNIKPVIFTYPVGKEQNFKGVIDVLGEKLLEFYDDGKEIVYKEIPNEYEEIAEKLKENLIETACDFDNILLEKYLNGDLLDNKDILNALKKGILTLKITPVYAGSALKNKGIQPLLDGIVSFLPSPDDISTIKAFNLKSGELTEIKIPENEFLGYIFKVQIINKRKICYVRVYSGKINENDEITILNSQQKNKISKIFKMHANKRTEISFAKKGDIVGIMLKTGKTGDTLVKNKSFQYILEEIKISNPVISLAIEPYTIKDQDFLLEVLSYIEQEDPSFKFKYDEELNQIIISGMGELHLEIILHRLEKEYNLKIKAGNPQVVYRETISEKSEGENIYELKIDDDKLYGHVKLTIEPLPRTGKDNSNIIEFKNELPIPEKVKNFIKEGLEEAFMTGFFINSPIIDTKVTITLVEDKTNKWERGSFKVATINAFKEAYQKSKPIKLEPVMEVIIVSPEEYTGDIIGDLNSRGAKILNIISEENYSKIFAEIYLGKLFGYTTILRSISKGKANFTMKFLRYDQL